MLVAWATRLLYSGSKNLVFRYYVVMQCIWYHEMVQFQCAGAKRHIAHTAIRRAYFLQVDLLEPIQLPDISRSYKRTNSTDDRLLGLHLFLLCVCVCWLFIVVFFPIWYSENIKHKLFLILNHFKCKYNNSIDISFRFVWLLYSSNTVYLLCVQRTHVQTYLIHGSANLMQLIRLFAPYI